MTDAASQPRPPGDEQLHAALDSALAASLGNARVRRVTRQPAAYTASCYLEELTVELGDGRIVEMMFKDAGQLVGTAREVKPAFLLNPEREIFVYRELLRAAEWGTPMCYGAIASARESRYWLFLEKVHGVQLRETGDFDRWQEAAAWLARFHLAFAPNAAALRRQSCLLQLDRDYFATWMPRALATVADHEMRESLARLGVWYSTIVERLASLPTTLIHGEFYPSNVLVREEPTGVAPIDWEMTAIGPGVLDRAALVTGWAHAEALALTRTYYSTAGPALGFASLDHLVEALELSRLHLAIQWLGWSAKWVVPQEHRHDWYQAAVTVAERLGFTRR